MTILHNHISDASDDYNNSTRTVLLHQHADSYSTTFTIAKLDRHEAIVTVMRHDGKAKSLRLSTIETDAFVAAWTAFKADIESAKAAKVAQLAADFAAALGLAREMREHLGELGTTEIKVDHSSCDHDTYHVNLPSLDWSYYNHRGTGYTLHNGTQLLEAVKQALVHIESEIETYQKSPSRSNWESPDKEKKEKFERWIIAWDAAQAWLEGVKATHFTSAKEETQPDYDEAAF